MSFIILSFIILIIICLLYFFSFYSSLNIRDVEKLSAYECGYSPMGNARMKFEILYYVIGILYLIFDLEIIFLFPLATILFSLNNYICFINIIIFLFILTVGFIYEWYHGALEIL